MPDTQDVPNAEPSQPVTEREKWNVETAFKKRELALAEQAHELAIREYELKAKDHAQSSWRNPLVVAILAATVAAVGNAVVAYTNGKLQRELEIEKSEQTRILEMIKTGDPDKAAENLGFLLDSGLIAKPDIVTKLDEFLRTRKAGSGPTLPSASPLGGIVGLDDARKIEDVSPTDPVKSASRSVGQLEVRDADSRLYLCSAFLVAKDLLLTAGHCISRQTEISTKTAASLVMASASNSVRYTVILPALSQSIGSGADETASFALFRVSGGPGVKHGYLRLADRPPVVGEPMAAVLFRGGKQQFVVLDAEDCKVLAKTAKTFTHGCDTGSGASGAPLLTRDGKEVVGLHSARMPDGTALSTRADTLLRAIRAHQSSAAK